MNNLMMRGKKSIAERIVYDHDLLKAKSNEEDALAVFKKVIENVKPMVEVKSPVLVNLLTKYLLRSVVRRTALGMRWIINFAVIVVSAWLKLAAELYDASR